jgi:hypothetical protein
MSAVVPLDPDSPRGMELAERLTQVFAQVRLAIAARSQSRPPKQGTPAPSPTPKPKPAPTHPKPPKKAAA